MRRQQWRWLLCSAVIVGALILSTCGAYLIGGIQGQRELYHRRYLEEREIVEPILASDSTYEQIQLSEKSDGGVDVWGTVPSNEDFVRLEQELQDALGHSRASQLMQGISISKDAG